MDENFIHDIAIFASAATYLMLGSNIRISVNTSVDKSRFVGSNSDPLYPEIIVWNSVTKETLVIEAIESTISIPDNVGKWKKFSKLAGNFILIVPYSQISRVKQILNAEDIHPTKLQTYIISGTKIEFIEERI